LITGLAMGALVALPWALAGACATATALLVYRVVALVHSGRELQRGQAEAEAADEAKSRFLANMSHELRTPLNGIMGFAELLHDERLGPVSPEQSDGLADILTSSRHLLTLINDILDLSRVAAGRIEFAPEPLCPRALAQECVDSLRSVADGQCIALRLEAPEQMEEVCLDPAKLRQVVFNYLSNAINFSEPGSSVSVRVHRDDARLRLEVSDAGPGIPPRDHERVFFEFEQLHGGLARRSGGTGLGLAVTKRLVEAQGGIVGVDSALGQGSTFFAELPVGDVVAAPARAQVHRLSDGLVARVAEAAA